MGNLAELTATLSVDASEYDKALDGAISKSDSFAEGLNSKLSTLGVAGFAVLGTAVAGTTALAVDFASQTNQAVNDLQAGLGLTRSEAEALGEEAKEVFGNNFGDSLADAAQGVETFQQNFNAFGVGAGEDLGEVTSKAFALRDTFDIDLAQSANAVSVLMQDFGLTAEEAFDFIASGAQRGLNVSGDLVESITEYSTQFANGGATADQFFSTLETGLGSGILGTDKAADLFKEFVVRIQDGSATTHDGLTQLGIDAEALGQGMADGSITAADAFAIVQDALRNTDDLNVQMQAGVALLGTQFEDLGVDAVMALDMGATSMEELAGSTDSLNAKYNNLGSAWETINRQFLLTIEPIGAALLDLANQAMPYIVAGFTALQEKIPAAFAWLQANVGPIFTAFVTGVQNAFIQAQPFIAFVQDNMGPIMSGLAAMLLMVVVPAFVAWAGAAITAAASTALALAPVILPIAAIGLAVGLLKAAWDSNWGDIQGKTKVAIDFLSARWEDLKRGFTTVAAGVTSLVSGAIEGFNSMKEGVSSTLEGLQEGMDTIFQGIYDNTIGKVKALWENTVGEFTRKYPQTTAKVASLRDDVQKIWNEIISRVTNAASQLWNSTIGKFTEGVRNALSKVEELKTQAIQKFNDLVSPARDAVGKVVDAIKDKFEDAKRAVGDKLNEIKDKIGSMASSFGDKAREIGSAIVNALKNAISDGANTIINALVDLAKQALDQVKKFLGIASPSRVFYEIGENSVMGLYNALTDGESLVAGAGEALAIAASAVSTPVVGGPAIAGNGGGIVIQIDTIDASGATMTREEYEEVTRRIFRELITQGRSTALAGI